MQLLWSSVLFAKFRVFDTFLALNPTIKMTWIKKNWGTSYIEMAENMIKDEVIALIAQFV